MIHQLILVWISIHLGNSMPYNGHNFVSIENELHEDISYKFVSIISSLEKFTKSFQPSISFNPWIPNEECSVSKEALDELKKSIDSTLSGVSVIREGGGGDITCEYSSTNINPNGNCEETIKLIQCGMQHVQTGFIHASKQNVSYGQHQELQNAFNQLQTKYQMNLDDVKKSVTEEYQKIIDELKTQIESLNEALAASVAKLRTVIIENSAYKIQYGHVENAIENWNELNDDSAITEIVQQAYILCTNSGENDETKNLIEFIYLSRDRSSFMDGYKTFMKSIEDHRKSINDPTVLVLAIACNEKGFNDEYKRHRDETVNIWSDAINRNDKIVYLLQLAEKYGNKFEQTNVTIDIVPNVYSGVNDASSNDGFQKMCNFIDNLSTISQKTIGFEAVINRMLQVSNWDNLNSIKLVIRIRTAAVPLIDRIPIPIYKLVYDSELCHFKNNFYNEYMYATEDHYALDGDRRRVFDWTPGQVIFNSLWDIVLRSDGGVSDDAIFCIKNNGFNEWLYTGIYDKLHLDGQRRTIATWRPGTLGGDQFEWIFIPVDNGQHFRIKTKLFGEYLYADGGKFFINNDRRYVVTWKGELPQEGEHYEQSKWIVSCN